MTDKATIESKKRELMGEVISDKMDKTIVVVVKNLVRHPLYGRIVAVAEAFYDATRPTNGVPGSPVAGLGDKVRIVESRPLSKLKRWRLVQVVEKATGVEKVEV